MDQNIRFSKEVKETRKFLKNIFKILKKMCELKLFIHLDYLTHTEKWKYTYTFEGYQIGLSYIFFQEAIWGWFLSKQRNKPTEKDCVIQETGDPPP